jgi:hypothetical protein
VPQRLNSSIDALRHVLVAVAYRLEHAVAGAPEGFAAFEPSGGARTPHELVRHLRRLVRLATGAWTGSAIDDTAPLDWEGELDALYDELRELDGLFQTTPAPQGDVGAHQVLQGPLLDAATHVGQLALLRRMAGAPVERRSFWRIEMPELNGEDLASADVFTPQ